MACKYVMATTVVESEKQKRESYISEAKLRNALNLRWTEVCITA